MRIGQQEASAPDSGNFSLARCPVDSDELAKHVIIADLNKSCLAPELFVLGIGADDGMVIDVIIAPQAGIRANDGVPFNTTSRADHRARLNNRVWTDLDVGGQLRQGIDNGGGMYRHAVRLLNKNRSVPEHGRDPRVI